MSQQYPGGFITKSPPTVVGPVDGEGGSAPGVWTLDQAMALNKQGLWPKPVLEKQLWAWGGNSSGQVGINSVIATSSPTQVGALTNWKQTSVGQIFSTAIKTDGTLWSWGRNNDGQLALGDIIDRSSPVQIGSLTNWQQVSAGGGFAAAIKTSGTLWSWGNNGSGQLGQNVSYLVQRSSPVQVGTLTNWATVSCGGNHCVAVKTNNTLWAWGSNNQGQLGKNDVVYRSSPVQVGALANWASVTTGLDFCVAVKTDGTLWSWGNNNQGQLGQNIAYNIDRSSPVQVGALTTWASVAAGDDFCVATKTDGTLWAWGQNGSGQLGQNDTISRSSPVQVGALTTWSTVGAGLNFCLAIKSDRTLWSWGDNTSGRLGLNNTVSRSSPVQVGALTKWLSTSQGSRASNALAIKSP